MAIIEIADKVKIQPWGELKPRLIEVNTLKAMAKVQSGMAHRYTVERTSDHRVRVTYSNPDEWGSEHPITAFYPCFKGVFDAWWVVTEITKIEGGRGTEERDYADQLFTWIEINDASNPNHMLEKGEVIR
jgi:hypothetical protein